MQSVRLFFFMIGRKTHIMIMKFFNEVIIKIIIVCATFKTKN